MTDAEQPMKTYRGNCHCGRFVFELTAPEELKASRCNCSVCTKKGVVWCKPKEEDFKFVKGAEKELAEYTFGSKQLFHKFCSTCGSAVMARSDAWKMIVVNLRNIQGPLNVWDMESSTFDGQALGEPYKPAVFSGPEPTAGPDNAKVYHGSCHCGAVKVAVRMQPIETLAYTGIMDSVVECDCSTCQRNASMWIYPPRNQVAIEGEENLTSYTHGLGIFSKTFCKTCGVPISSEVVDLPADKFAALPESAQGWQQKVRPIRPITIRILDDFDFTTVRTSRHNGSKQGASSYVNP